MNVRDYQDLFSKTVTQNTTWNREILARPGETSRAAMKRNLLMHEPNKIPPWITGNASGAEKYATEKRKMLVNNWTKKSPSPPLRRNCARSGRYHTGRVRWALIS